MSCLKGGNFNLLAPGLANVCNPDLLRKQLDHEQSSFKIDITKVCKIHVPSIDNCRMSIQSKCFSGIASMFQLNPLTQPPVCHLFRYVDHHFIDNDV